MAEGQCSVCVFVCLCMCVRVCVCVCVSVAYVAIAFVTKNYPSAVCFLPPAVRDFGRCT